MTLRTRAGRVLLAVLVVALTAVTAAPASAHAVLVKSTPADGTSLTRAPSKAVLTFDENIRDPSKVIVDGPDGTRVDSGGTQVLDSTVSTDVSVRASGTYTVAYRVISADGHPVSGTVRFSYGTDGTAPAPSPAATPGPSRAPWAVGGGLVVVLVLVAAWLLLRRRTPADAPPEHGS